ncbi:MAG: sugar phosphate nucleotidyltransferase [Thermodesulfobacteriota bacterium]
MKAIILAGGKGSRLAPYTTVLPKPLMPIGDVPVLEVIVRQLRLYGFDEIIMAVGHLAELLKAYFNKGEKYGLRIRYSKEPKDLGTAGPLSLIPDLDDTFLVMNGDILTTLDYSKLIDFHRQKGNTATIAMCTRCVEIDFGVITVDSEDRIIRYNEKPKFNYLVSMGAYVFEPQVLKYIKLNEKFDFPELVQRLIQNGERIQGYSSNDYWLDIGRPDDYQKAVEDFVKLKDQLLK